MCTLVQQPLSSTENPSFFSLFGSCLSASPPPPVFTSPLQKAQMLRLGVLFFIQVFFFSSSFFFFFFWLFHPYLTSPPLFPLHQLKKKEGGITNLIFRLIPPRPLETVTSPPSPRLFLGLSSVEKHPSLSFSLSLLYLYLSLSIPLSPSLPLSLSSRSSSPHSVSTAAALCLPPLSLFRQAVG